MKIFRIMFGVSIIFIFAFFGFTLRANATIEFPTIAGLSHGALIKTADSSTVYYFGDDEQRYAFPNEKTYFTWYSDFESIITLTSKEMSDISLAGVVTYHPQFGSGPNSRLLKTIWSPAVYVSIGDGYLIELKDEDTAQNLFGDNWVDLVDSLSDAFIPYYTILGGDIGVGTKFVQLYDSYTISEDKGINKTTGVMVYSDPLRFASSDEFEDCGESYCVYNEVTVQQGNAIKFVNRTNEMLVVREENNLWTTGVMNTDDIVIIQIDDNPGVYNFYVDSDQAVAGILTVK